jgi:hypothetical protein
MIKTIIRAIASILVLCLIADPALAADLSQQRSIAGRNTRTLNQSQFTEQALAAQLVAVAQRRHGDITSREWRLLTAIYEAIPGYRRFATTTAMGPILPPKSSAATGTKLEDIVSPSLYELINRAITETLIKGRGGEKSLIGIPAGPLGDRILAFIQQRMWADVVDLSACPESSKSLSTFS